MKARTDRTRFRRAVERLVAEGFYYANACCPSCGFAEAEAAGATDIVNINDQGIGWAFYGDSGRIPNKRLPAMMVMPLYVSYDGRPERLTEADALIAYLQVLGTFVDFKLYDDKANVR